MNPLRKALRWLMKKSLFIPSASTGGSPSPFIDSFKRRRNPSNEDLLQEIKNTAFVCASINAATCAAFPPRIFVKNRPGMPEAKCATQKLDRITLKHFKARSWIAPMLKASDDIAEVTDHPLITLFENVNPILNAHDLLELTTWYQEIFGYTYWMIVKDYFGRPSEIWPLPSQSVMPSTVRPPFDPANLARSLTPEWYDVLLEGHSLRVSPDHILTFMYPDPRNPYANGLSPLRAAFESINLNSEFIAHKQALWENRARPDAILSPGEIIGEEERQRLEEEFNDKFRRGGTGRILVAETNMRLDPLNFPINEVGMLAEHASTKEDIANAFGVPLSYLTKETNLSNLQASDELYMGKAIRPRLHRRDQKITERLCRLYDPTGRLFVAAEDPVPEDKLDKREQARIDLEHGVRTINEVRAEQGLPPVKWGELPWLPTYFAPADPDNPNRNLFDPQGKPLRTQGGKRAKESQGRVEAQRGKTPYHPGRMGPNV